METCGAKAGFNPVVIQRFSHVTLYVLDQDAALEFYTAKLGFVTRIDFRIDNGFRWLTVSPQDQEGAQIVLQQLGGPFVDPETTAAIGHLLKEGKLGTALVFQTEDCRGTCAALASKGVMIVSAPTEHFHGVEAIIADDSGNRFVIHQPKGIDNPR